MFKWKRKAFRLVGLLFPTTLYAFGPYGFAVTLSILSLFLTIMVVLEYYRFRYPGVNRWLFRSFRDYTKEKERAKLSGTTLYLISCWIVVLLFPASIAIAAMIFLVFGDAVAEWIGIRFGRVPLLGKTLEGTLAGFTACFTAGGLLLLLPGLDLTWGGIFAGALAATVMELLPVPIDDNFSVPLLSAAVMKWVQVFL